MKKLHHVLFNLLIFLLPTQLGKHFWFPFSYISGLRIDYYSPTLYFTDLLIVFIVLGFFLEKRKVIKKHLKNITLKKNKVLLLTLIFLFYLLLNSLFAPSPMVALEKLIRIFLFFLLGLYVSQIKIQKKTLFFLSLSLLYIFFITLLQFIDKSSLGGIFYWFGERTFNLSTPGIAKIAIGGREILRPYATFPHPNALAGFVLIALLLITVSKRPLFLAKPILISSLVTIFLTFSRSAWIATMIFLPSSFFLSLPLKKSVKTFFKPMLISLGLVILILSLLPLPNSNLTPKNLTFSAQSLSLRIKLNQTSLEMIKQNPLFGVGLNNFILSLPKYSSEFSQTLWLQPVHNLYLLILSETGFVGFIFLLSLIYLTLKKILSSKTISSLPLFCILFLGFFDHYFFTLQQTQLLFTFILSLSWAKSARKK